LSDGDDIFSGVGSPTSYGINLNPGNRRLEWGNSAFDHRHFFSVAYVYQIPGAHVSNNFADAALGLLTRHWTISGVTQLQSGQYSTISTSGLDINGDGSSTNDRPVVGNKSLPLTSVGIDGIYLGAPFVAGTLYNLTAYDVAANATLANVPSGTASNFHFIVPYDPGNQLLTQTIGRDSFRIPGTTTNNIALEKGFGLSYLHFSRGTFIFRAEAQNIANHNDLTVGDTDVLDAGAGYLNTSRVNSQRTLILWGKIQF
jgi:hypothetical protein